MAKKRSAPSTKVAAEQIQQFEMLRPLLQTMRESFEELSKKKPEGTLSKTKVGMVNRLLMPIQKLLENEANHQFLDMLDEIDLPQNSDVVLILGQTLTAMDTYYKNHSREDGYDTVWDD